MRIPSGALRILIITLLTFVGAASTIAPISSAHSFVQCADYEDWDEADPLWNDPWHWHDGLNPPTECSDGGSQCEWRFVQNVMNRDYFHNDHAGEYTEDHNHPLCGM